MPQRTRAISLVAVCFFLSLLTCPAAPPFSGTIFLDPDIVTPDDPTTFLSLTDAGRGTRTMYDRRVPGWITPNAYLFTATFSIGDPVEVQVNPEFGSTAAARTAAASYLPAIGQLPVALRRDLRTVWIHLGNNAFGGGNNNLLIHTGQASRYIRDGILEETLIHEAAHTSLDADHASASGWVAAQNADPEFISTYARDNPTREDIAETFLPYLALRYRSNRISSSLAATISETIPNRIAYLDSLDLDLRPLYEPIVPTITSVSYNPTTLQLALTLRSNPNQTYTLFRSDSASDWIAILEDVPAEGESTDISTTLPQPTPRALFRVTENPK